MKFVVTYVYNCQTLESTFEDMTEAGQFMSGCTVMGWKVLSVVRR